MLDPKMPRYPIYIPSKGRWDVCYTAKALARDSVPFRLVVEPQEADAYAGVFGRDFLLVLPFSNLGMGSIPARNYIWDHARQSGSERHWVLDDNMRRFLRRWKSRRIPCHAGSALGITEDFVDRYENVAIAGLAYEMFAKTHGQFTPFFHNVHVYSCMLLMTGLPFRWRGRYNEDTDLCLQVLSAGWCTILMYAFLVTKIASMTVKGGNTSELYAGDGRLKMAKSLERMWPGVVTTSRRFSRPQHMVKDSWKRFDTPLKLKPGLQLPEGPDEHGMRLTKFREVTSPTFRSLLEDS
jgi:hypothetical protein